MDIKQGGITFRANADLKSADAVMPDALPGAKAGNSFIDKISSLAAFARNQSNFIFEFAKQECEQIIQTKSTDSQRIERTLDSLLECFNFGLGEKEILLLIEYYDTFNKEGASFYRQEYQSIKAE